MEILVYKLFILASLHRNKILYYHFKVELLEILQFLVIPGVNMVKTNWLIYPLQIIDIRIRVFMVIIHKIEHILDRLHAYHKRNNKKRTTTKKQNRIIKISYSHTRAARELQQRNKIIYKTLVYTVTKKKSISNTIGPRKRLQRLSNHRDQRLITEFHYIDVYLE